MALPVSVVVVSRGRPAALRRCLTGIAQLDYAPFEVIVVACPDGADMVAGRPDADRVKLVRFDEANISAARNLGIAQAAGEVVAFIDDDAVPEPLWLTHLTGPFAEEQAAAAGGYVIGRNGISFQWTARGVDRTGQATPIEVEGTEPVLLQPTEDRAIKTEGTNMAVRRSVLAALGGFDPAFRFYLDETDLNLRLARAGLATAIVPLAQVHHGFAESPRRAPDRTPRDLTEIGASIRVFLRKHCPPAQQKHAWRRERDAQRRRLMAFLQRGPLDPWDALRLMRSLKRGEKTGRTRELGRHSPIPPAASAFLPYPGRQGATRAVIAGRPRQAQALHDEARARVDQGAIVSLFLLSPTSLYHHVKFNDSGVWEQHGGQFGRSLRAAPLVRPWRFRNRVNAELTRLAPVRGCFPELKSG